MTAGPYLNSYLPVSRASDALRNQADTILSELHASIDRAHAFRAKLEKRKQIADLAQGYEAALAAQRAWEVSRAIGKAPELAMPYAAPRSITFIHSSWQPAWYRRGRF